MALSPQYGALFYMAVSILVPHCGCRVNEDGGKTVPQMLHPLLCELLFLISFAPFYVLISSKKTFKLTITHPPPWV